MDIKVSPPSLPPSLPPSPPLHRRHLFPTQQEEDKSIHAIIFSYSFPPPNKQVNLATTLPLIDDARPIKQRIVVASFPERSNRMWRYFEQRRYQIYVKGEETEVDDELAAQICGILTHAPEGTGTSRVLVFVTGDGNAHKGQHSFPQLVILALQRGYVLVFIPPSLISSLPRVARACICV